MSGYEAELSALRKYRDGKTPFSSDSFRQVKKSTLPERPKEVLTASKRRNSIRPVDRAAAAAVVCGETLPGMSEYSPRKNDPVHNPISSHDNPLVALLSPTQISSLSASASSAVFPSVSAPGLGGGDIPPPFPMHFLPPPTSISSFEQHDRLTAMTHILMETLLEQGALRAQLQEAQESSLPKRQKGALDHKEGEGEEKENEVHIRLRGALLELEKTVQKLVMTKTSLQQEEARSSRAERALEITLRQLQDTSFQLQQAQDEVLRLAPLPPPPDSETDQQQLQSTSVSASCSSSSRSSSSRSDSDLDSNDEIPPPPSPPPEEDQQSTHSPRDKKAHFPPPSHQQQRQQQQHEDTTSPVSTTSTSSTCPSTPLSLMDTDHFIMLDIDLGNDSKGGIRVTLGADALSLAYSFVQENALNLSYVDPLMQYIEKTKDTLRKEEISRMDVDTSRMSSNASRSGGVDVAGNNFNNEEDNEESAVHEEDRVDDKDEVEESAPSVFLDATGATKRHSEIEKNTNTGIDTDADSDVLVSDIPHIPSLPPSDEDNKNERDGDCDRDAVREGDYKRSRGHESGSSIHDTASDDHDEGDGPSVTYTDHVTPPPPSPHTVASNISPHSDPPSDEDLSRIFHLIQSGDISSTSDLVQLLAPFYNPSAELEVKGENRESRSKRRIKEKDIDKQDPTYFPSHSRNHNKSQSQTEGLKGKERVSQISPPTSPQEKSNIDYRKPRDTNSDTEEEGSGGDHTLDFDISASYVDIMPLSASSNGTSSSPESSSSVYSPLQSSSQSLRSTALSPHTSCDSTILFQDLDSSSPSLLACTRDTTVASAVSPSATSRDEDEDNDSDEDDIDLIGHILEEEHLTHSGGKGDHNDNGDNINNNDTDVDNNDDEYSDNSDLGGSDWDDRSEGEDKSRASSHSRASGHTADSYYSRGSSFYELSVTSSSTVTAEQEGGHSSRRIDDNDSVSDSGDSHSGRDSESRRDAYSDQEDITYPGGDYTGDNSAEGYTGDGVNNMDDSLLSVSSSSNLYAAYDDSLDLEVDVDVGANVDTDDGRRSTSDYYHSPTSDDRSNGSAYGASSSSSVPRPNFGTHSTESVSATELEVELPPPSHRKRTSALREQQHQHKQKLRQHNQLKQHYEQQNERQQHEQHQPISFQKNGARAMVAAPDKEGGLTSSLRARTSQLDPLEAAVDIFDSATTLANDGFIDDAVPLYLHALKIFENYSYSELPLIREEVWKWVAVAEASSLTVEIEDIIYNAAHGKQTHPDQTYSPEQLYKKKYNKQMRHKEHSSRNRERESLRSHNATSNVTTSSSMSSRNSSRSTDSKSPSNSPSRRSSTNSFVKSNSSNSNSSTRKSEVDRLVEEERRKNLTKNESSSASSPPVQSLSSSASSAAVVERVDPALVLHELQTFSSTVGQHEHRSPSTHADSDSDSDAIPRHMSEVQNSLENKNDQPYQQAVQKKELQFDSFSANASLLRKAPVSARPAPLKHQLSMQLQAVRRSLVHVGGDETTTAANYNESDGGSNSSGVFAEQNYVKPEGFDENDEYNDEEYENDGDEDSSVEEFVKLEHDVTQSKKSSDTQTKLSNSRFDNRESFQML